MGIFGDVVSIAATTAGVAGDIKVTQGARLIGLNLSATGTAGVVVTKINIAWPGLQQPVSFVPNMLVVPTTNGSAVGTCKTPLVDLSKLPPVAGQNTVTITITTTGNQTIEAGLMWIA
jgi:hypothetical protein